MRALILALLVFACVAEEPAPWTSCGPMPDVLTLNGRYELLPDGRNVAVIDAEEFHRWRVANEALLSWGACMRGEQ